jgi:hypothetical protein
VYVKLNRSLYGLKQSPRMWNKKIDGFLLSIGFLRTFSDSSVYCRRQSSSLALIALYVDDLIILTDTLKTMNELKAALSRRFEMTDCGELHHCLGLSVSRDRRRRRLALSQTSFVREVLNRFDMSDCKPVMTPLEATVLLKPATEGEKLTDLSNYRSIVGSLMYLMVATRPDMATAVSVVSQFAAKPTITHLVAAKRILRYLQHSQDYELVLHEASSPTSPSSTYVDGKFPRDLNPSPSSSPSIDLYGYSDATWADDVNSGRSTTGYIFYLNGGCISWCSKRQPTVAHSSAESEYMAISQAAREAVWLRALLVELGIKLPSTTIFGDNQSCIALAKNPVHHARTKHIAVRHHYVREKVESKELHLQYVPTADMVADALTKGLPRPKFQELTAKMGLWTSKSLIRS